MTTSSHETYEILVMKAVDGQLTEPEEQQLHDHLSTCQACREELKDFQWIKQSTDRVRQRILQDSRLKPFQETGAVKAWNAFHLVLVFLGSLGLLIFSTYTFFLDPKVHVFVKWATGCAGLGGLGLFLYLLQNRLRQVSHDPYRHIDI